MELSMWQLAFSILQILFVFILGWFIKILYAVNTRMNCLEVRVNELEKKDGIRKLENKNILEKLDEFKETFKETMSEFKVILREKLGAIL